MKQGLRAGLGFAIGIFLVWLLFRNTDWGKVWAATRHVNLGWLLMTQVILLASFVIRIQRWAYVVRAAKPVSFRHMFSATQIGFLANMVLPLRAGEFVRAFVLGRLAQLPFPKSMAMVALDRVTDLVGLLVVMLVAVLAFPKTGAVIPPGALSNSGPLPISSAVIQSGAIGFAVFLVLVLGILVTLYLNQEMAFRASDRIVGAVSGTYARRVHGMLQHFAEGLHVFRSGSDMAKSVFFSLVTWACFTLALVGFLRAFDLTFPWYAPFVIQSMLAAAVSVPGMPGFVGQFHFAIIASMVLVMPAATVPQAQAVAIVGHLLNVIPTAIVGVLCLAWENMRLFELTKQATQARHDLGPTC